MEPCGPSNRISVLKENQQMLGNKINMLQATNKKKEEEADKIRELIAECRENLNRIKGEALNSSQKREKSPCDGRSEFGTSSTRSTSSEPGSGRKGKGNPCEETKRSQAVPCTRTFQLTDRPCGANSTDPCAKYRNLPLKGREPNFGASNLDEVIAKYRNMKPCEDPCAEVREKSRQCVEKLGEEMEREVKMRIIKGNETGCPQSTRDPCQERVSCKVDLSKMKVNVSGPPEDLKKLDAVQLINLLDKFHCQELVITSANNRCQFAFQEELPIFYITHPGNLVLIVGIAMVAFLVNANLCNPRRDCRTKLFLNMLYLGSFAFHYGIVLWMTFIRGLTLSMGLPRDVYNTVDNLILPKYFSICIFLSAISLYTFLASHCTAPCTSWPLPVIVQIIILSTTFILELLAICYVVPAIVKLREITDGMVNRENNYPLTENNCRNILKLCKLNRTITLINILTVVFMGSNMYYITTKLNIG